MLTSSPNKTPPASSGIPLQTKIFSVDATMNTESCLFISPRIFCYSSKFNSQFYFFTDAFDRDITPQRIASVAIYVFITVSHKRNLRKIIYIKKITTHQVFVSVCIVGCNRTCIDPTVDFTLKEISLCVGSITQFLVGIAHIYLIIYISI